MGKLILETTHLKSAPGAQQAIALQTEESDRFFSCSDEQPLTEAERQELDEKLGKLPPSTADELRRGVECLPKGTRDRALYNWAKRTRIPDWYRP